MWVLRINLTSCDINVFTHCLLFVSEQWTVEKVIFSKNIYWQYMGKTTQMTQLSELATTFQISHSLWGEKSTTSLRSCSMSWLSTGWGCLILCDHMKTGLSICIFSGIFFSLIGGLANYWGLENQWRYSSTFHFRSTAPMAGSCLPNVYPTHWWMRWMLLCREVNLLFTLTAASLTCSLMLSDCCPCRHQALLTCSILMFNEACQSKVSRNKLHRKIEQKMQPRESFDSSGSTLCLFIMALSTHCCHCP